MPDEKLSFLKYYWLCFKHFGKRLWTSRGNELLSALVWAAAAFIVSFAFSDAGAFKSFEIAILVVLAWLTLYAIVHTFKTPWLIHRGENGQTHQRFGFVGIGVAVLIVIELAVLLFHVATRTPEASKQC